MPEHGKIHLWRPATGLPGPGRDVRYETAIQTGSSVSIHFDSMIAKLVIWAPSRSLAVQKMANVLANMVCIGVRTNQLSLQRCLTHPAFQVVRYNTSFIPVNLDALLRPPEYGRTLDLAATSVSSVFVRRVLPQLQRHPQIQRPFRSILPHFRNQRLDPVSVQCDVVRRRSVESAARRTHPHLWLPAPSGPTEQAFQVAVLDSQDSELVSPPESHDTKLPSAKTIADQYNQISNKQRSAAKGSHFAKTNVRVLGWRPITQTQSSPSARGALAATLELAIDEFKCLAHCVLPGNMSSSLDESQTIFCHFPQLGTYIELERGALLSYIEACGAAEETQRQQGQHSILAPMPCKVLAVVKEPGEEVQIGDTVMVIESMKMEVSIRASWAGKFETSWQPGDPVEEGKVLCQVK